MELFYASRVDGTLCYLDGEEAQHCVRVLRHREGDAVSVIDGAGTLYRCELSHADPREAQARIIESIPSWGSHPYHLTLAVCPTKNIDRYEWFVEKAVELGVDRIVPVIGERSERRLLRTDRLRKIALSATKQSLKAQLPQIDEPVSVQAFLDARQDPAEDLRLIAYCFEGDTPRQSVVEVLRDYAGASVTVMIGPEGDFSPSEAAAALSAGFRPIHLGPSRLRTETAAVTAAEAVYLRYL